MFFSSKVGLTVPPRVGTEEVTWRCENVSTLFSGSSLLRYPTPSGADPLADVAVIVSVVPANIAQ